MALRQFGSLLIYLTQSLYSWPSSTCILCPWKMEVIRELGERAYFQKGLPSAELFDNTKKQIEIYWNRSLLVSRSFNFIFVCIFFSEECWFYFSYFSFIFCRWVMRLLWYILKSIYYPLCRRSIEHNRLVEVSPVNCLHRDHILPSLYCHWYWDQNI